MKLSECLCESGISLKMRADSKPEILSRLVEMLAEVAGIENQDSIVEMLEERENLKSTGIGLGVAMPHCKTPQVDKINVVFGISGKEIDFKAIDDKPCRFFFLLAAPEKAGSEHLKMIAKIVRFIRNSSVRENLLKLKSAGDVIDYIKREEQNS